MESDGDLDAPEELTSEQGIKLDEQIRKLQRENKIRFFSTGEQAKLLISLPVGCNDDRFAVFGLESNKPAVSSFVLLRDGKLVAVSDSLLLWDSRLLWVVQEGKERRRLWGQRKSQSKSGKERVREAKALAPVIRGMLPSNIVNLLADREKQTFTSDSEEEVVNHKPAKLKKKQKSSGPDTVLLEEIPPAQCLENSMEFLMRRKMKVSRSNSVLINAKQALRLLSTHGNLLSKG